MENGHAWVNRILFATDFSLCAYHAEEHLAVLSKVYGSTVDVVHVMEAYPGVYAAVQEPWETDGRLHEVVRRLQRLTIPVSGHQLIGNPSVQICETAMKCRADLIVLGTHGRTGLDRLLLGSTAERVLTMAHCPVLTVGAPKGSDGRRHMYPVTFERVLAPIDFSDCSLDALEYGSQIAKDFGAALTLLHVLESVAHNDDQTLAQQDGLKARIDSQFVPYVGAIRSAGISVGEAIQGGDPADAILDWAITSLSWERTAGEAFRMSCGAVWPKACYVGRPVPYLLCGTPTLHLTIDGWCLLRDGPDRPSMTESLRAGLLLSSAARLKELRHLARRHPSGT